MRNTWLNCLESAVDKGRDDIVIISADLGFGVYELLKKNTQKLHKLRSFGTKYDRSCERSGSNWKKFFVIQSRTFQHYAA